MVWRRIATMMLPRVAGGAQIWTRDPSGKRRREQRMLAVDALVGRRGDLPREPPQRGIVEPRLVVALDPRRGLEPHFARAVDVEIGDVAAFEEGGQRREEGVEIDPLREVHRAGPASIERASRSRSTINPTCMLIPNGRP